MQFHEVTLMTFRNGKKLRIYDCRGVHDNAWASEIYKKDLIQAIDGCIKKDYEVCIFSFFTDILHILIFLFLKLMII